MIGKIAVSKTIDRFPEDRENLAVQWILSLSNFRTTDLSTFSLNPIYFLIITLINFQFRLYLAIFVYL